MSMLLYLKEHFALSPGLPLPVLPGMDSPCPESEAFLLKLSSQEGGSQHKLPVSGCPSHCLP